jgi:hypothetical protein
VAQSVTAVELLRLNGWINALEPPAACNEVLK